MAVDIFVHRFTAVWNGSATHVQQIQLRGASYDRTRLFVRHTDSLHKKSTQQEAYAGGPQGGDPLGNYCTWLSIADAGGGFADVTITISAAHTALTSEVTVEVWEYLGAPGGPNEFIVRAASFVTFNSAVGIGSNQLFTVLGIVIGNVQRVVPFTRGIELTAGATLNVTGATMVTLFALDFIGPRLFWSRGLTNATLAFRAHYDLVEFTGSNWTVGQARGLPPPGATQSFALDVDIVDWSQAFIYAQRRNGTGNQTGFLGVALWPGASSATVRARADANSPTNTTNNEFVAYAIRNPELVVEHQNAIDGGGSLFPSVGVNSTQTEFVPTANVVDPEYVSLYTSHFMDGVHGYNGSFEWITRIEPDGSGGYRVRWFRRRSRGDDGGDMPGALATYWTQQVVRFESPPQFIDVDFVDAVPVQTAALPVPLAEPAAIDAAVRGLAPIGAAVAPSVLPVTAGRNPRIGPA